MDETLTPRERFVKNISSLFEYKLTPEDLKNHVMNNVEEIDILKRKIARMDLCKELYIKEYDSKTTEKEKMQVQGSVIRDRFVSKEEIDDYLAT